MHARRLRPLVFLLACLTAPPALAVCGDGVAELPIEGCDGADDLACPGTCIAPGQPDECQCSFPVCGDAVVALPEECEGLDRARCANGCRPDCTCEPLDHYQCYEIKPAAFMNRDFTMDDTFGTLAVRTRYPNRVCTPADKNGEGVVDPVSHLTGYPVRVTFARQRDVDVTNQFGDLRLDVLRPDLVMIPTETNGVAIPPANDLDHFQCYKVRRASGSSRFKALDATLEDPFGPATVRLLRPIRLCVPASKNGEDPTAPVHSDALLCYRTRARAPFGTQDVDIANQFGLDSLRLIHRRELCVPSRLDSAVE